MSWLRRMIDRIPPGGTGYMAAKLARHRAARDEDWLRERIRDAVRLRPGDRIGVLIDENLPMDEVHELNERLQERWPEAEVVLLQGVRDLISFRPEE